MISSRILPPGDDSMTRAASHEQRADEWKPSQEAPSLLFFIPGEREGLSELLNRRFRERFS
jgi:hypothetical protein